MLSSQQLLYTVWSVCDAGIAPVVSLTDPPVTPEGHSDRTAFVQKRLHRSQEPRTGSRAAQETQPQDRLWQK